MVFPVVIYGYESWTIKKAECQRIDAFELWSWRRLLRMPWTTRRSKQSILKEISPEYSLEGLMQKRNSNPLATWYKELTHWKRPWCWERLKAGGEGDDRGWDDLMASPTWWTWVWVNSGSWWWTGRPGVLQSMGSQRVRHDWVTKLDQPEEHRRADATVFLPDTPNATRFNLIAYSGSTLNFIPYAIYTIKSDLIPSPRRSSFWLPAHCHRQTSTILCSTGHTAVWIMGSYVSVFASFGLYQSL